MINPAKLEAFISRLLLVIPAWLWVFIAAAAAVSLLLALSLTAIRAEHRRPRDPQRLFTAEQRALLRARCGHQCEYNPWWGPRCSGGADHADHIHPWSRGGATTIENGQMLCASHNLAKSDWRPTTFYVWRLTRRRRDYYPSGATMGVWKYYGTPPPWRS